MEDIFGFIYLLAAYCGEKPSNCLLINSELVYVCETEYEEPAENLTYYKGGRKITFYYGTCNET